MSEKVKFCHRFDAEGSVDQNSFVLRRGGESDSDYYDRLVGEWSDRFSRMGFVYLLPHHYLNDFMHIRRYDGLKNYPALLRTIMLDHLAVGIQESRGVRDGSFIDSEIETVKATGFNFHVPYNQDILGKNLRYKVDYSVAEVSILAAIIQGDYDMVLGCLHTYDPYCYLAGCFGGGKHCLASSIDQYQKAAFGKDSSDASSMAQMIQVIKQKNLVSKNLSIHIPKQRHVYSRIRMKKQVAIGNTGEMIVDEMKRLENEEADLMIALMFNLPV